MVGVQGLNCWEIFSEFWDLLRPNIGCGFIKHMLGCKIGSGGASSVPPVSFLIRPDLLAVNLGETLYYPFSSNGNGEKH